MRVAKVLHDFSVYSVVLHALTDRFVNLLDIGDCLFLGIIEVCFPPFSVPHELLIISVKQGLQLATCVFTEVYPRLQSRDNLLEGKLS